MKQKIETPYRFPGMKKQSFEFNGNPVAWYKIGEGKPLLILHGWGSSSKIMLPAAKSLKDIRSCYLLDFPGFGNSPEPGEAWTIDRYADLVEQFLNQISGEEPVDLFVHSFGARVLLKLLTRNSVNKKIEKVIITGGAGLKPKRSFKFYLKKYTALLLKTPLRLLPRPIQEKALQKLRDTRLWSLLGSSDYKQLSGVMRETFVKSVNEYLDDLVQDIGHEVLLIWGDNDTATPIEQGVRLEKGLKNGVLVKIENAGHYAFLDKPQQFSAICRAYLESESK